MIIIMTIRSFLIVIGAYKDPLLATFESYGELRLAKPIVMFVLWIIMLIYIMLFWYMHSAFVFAVGLTLFIPVGAFYIPILRFINRYEETFTQYPHWYHELVEIADREERRRIAYMWLRLPPATRMIYNVNQTSFRHWVEQVLLTVAQ